MSRYVRMVLLLLAGVFFMIPMLGRSAAARPMPRMHGQHVNNMHHTIQTEGFDDDSSAPCVDQ